MLSLQRAAGQAEGGDTFRMNRIRQLLASDAAIFALILISAITVLYRSAFNASNFEISPDPIEYASAGYHLAAEGHYCITMNGRSFPPRYPPWFSLLVAAPAYKLLRRRAR